MPPEIPKAYEPQEIEERWAKAWFDEKLFRAENSGDGPAFSIALPPPNITGSIHIGHLLEHTQIDMLVRWHRMKGHRTLWLPGMDHAGIATQFVVERKLAAEKIRRQDLGREEFERRVWKWKEESGGVIKDQMIRLGASCDWTREHFTLEPKLYRAVLEAFLRLYREGLIYRGRYMVNWCPRCQTAISDLEVVHNERVGEIWNIRYPITGSSELLVVATTRPETMLGDTAVAVHPDDERYQRFIGKTVMLPMMNREIPIIADAYVDREFGTGVVKITPAHDPNDFEVGKRHHLPEIDVMTNDGHMNDAAGKYAGLDRFAARGRIVSDLTELGLLEGVKEHTHAVGTCDRCKSIVEPRISTQWFMKMKPLAEPAKEVVNAHTIEVVPDNQRTILLQWLENIRDWCISRQLWWGHRIPIWHCVDCKEMVPALDSRVEIVEGHARAASVPTKCPKCGGSKLTQDPDVLDTWFSSALWPFSTLGWPDDTEDLRTFYPTSLLISGYDILFFWDSRMIMMGLKLTGGAAPKDRIPFRRLYLHSLVRTAEGAKMSKTKGTGVDPLQLTQQYGTDALRYMLASMAAPGTDIALTEDRILGARAFANKIWNAARFLFVNLEKVEATGLTLEDLAAPDIRAKAPYRVPGEGALAHRWIFSRLACVASQVDAALESFRFHEACQTIYQFFWGDFCDWYIEWVKPQLASTDRDVALAAWRNIFAALDAALRLLHPVMPFLTEELWHRLPQPAGARSIALDRFPEAHAGWTDQAADDAMAILQEIVVAARNIRAEMKLDPRQKVAAEFSTRGAGLPTLLRENLDPVLRLAALSELKISRDHLDPQGAVVRSTAAFDLRIAFGDTVDKEAEKARLKKKIAELEKDIAGKHARLADKNFTSKAPGHVVDALRATMMEREVELRKLRDRLSQLES
ncbi:MAG TPA: valine--tRNA ligase [Candidatus Acidoferrales bacterium]|jgi:valyl-tRNA synthetase|nr:valine--tRNA ligase [Candidatus Acidoferrales bacterium]